MSILFCEFDKIRNLPLSNRLVYPPMATHQSGKDDGKVTQQLLDYYDDKTKGGYFGLCIIEHSFVSHEGKAKPNMLSVSDDSDIAGLSELAKVIQANGSKAVMQINHAGSGTCRETTGMDVLAPSLLKNPKNHLYDPRKPEFFPDRIITIHEINKLVQCFASAARRVKEAGFDAVEIHAAHIYILAQFFSPLTNQREDEYGGNLENRTRLHLDVIEAVRNAVGADFPVFMRFGACDFLDGGSTIDEAVTACGWFEEAGIDMLDITGGLCGYHYPFSRAEGYFYPVTRAIKKKVKIPVMLTGGFKKPETIEEFIEAGFADLVGVGRMALKDSEWGKRAFAHMDEVSRK